MITKFSLISGKVLPIFLLLFALVGCGEKEATLSGKTESSAKERTVVVFTWEEYFDPEVIEKFESETGIKVEFEFFESLGELTAQLQNRPDAFDLVVVDDVTLSELIEVKSVQPLLAEKVSNIGNIDKRYLNQPFDPGNEYSVPYLWGTTLLAYRSDKLIDPEPSWSILWDPALKGRVALMDEKDDLYASALLSLGLPLDTENPEHLEAATRRLALQVEQVAPVFSSLEDIKDRLLTGKCDIACIYSGDAAILAEEDENISYFIPNEGAPIWMDNLAVTREARNLDEAHEFINFISRGDVAAQNANYLWYATPNEAAQPLLNEELLADESVYPALSVLDRCGFHPQPSLARMEIMNRGMKKVFDWARSEMVQAGTDQSETE